MRSARLLIPALVLLLAGGSRAQAAVDHTLPPPPPPSRLRTAVLATVVPEGALVGFAAGTAWAYLPAGGTLLQAITATAFEDRRDRRLAAPDAEAQLRGVAVDLAVIVPAALAAGVAAGVIATVVDERTGGGGRLYPLTALATLVTAGATLVGASLLFPALLHALGDDVDLTRAAILAGAGAVGALTAGVVAPLEGAGRDGA